jgi:hypothetical protein
MYSIHWVRVGEMLVLNHVPEITDLKSMFSSIAHPNVESPPPKVETSRPQRMRKGDIETW